MKQSKARVGVLSRHWTYPVVAYAKIIVTSPNLSSLIIYLSHSQIVL